MGIKSEKKLKQLEDELKALKATYSIYGGSMELYYSSFHIDNYSGSFKAKVRFTPDYPGNLFVSSIFYEMTGSLGTWNFSQYAFIDSDNDSNGLTFVFPALEENITLSIVATSPGSFTLLT